MSAHSIYLELITGEKRFAVINYPANWALSSIIVCVCAAYLVYKRDLLHDCFSGFRRLIRLAISTMTIIQLTDTESSVQYWKAFIREFILIYLYLHISCSVFVSTCAYVCGFVFLFLCLPNLFSVLKSTYRPTWETVHWLPSSYVKQKGNGNWSLYIFIDFFNIIGDTRKNVVVFPFAKYTGKHQHP